MSFFSDFADSVTGASGQSFSENQLKQQLGFGQQVLNEHLQEAQLQFSPTLQAEKNKMYIAIAVILGIVILIVVKKLAT